MQTTTKIILMSTGAGIVLLAGYHVYTNVQHAEVKPSGHFAALREKQTTTSCEDTSDTTPTFTTQSFRPSSAASSEAFRLCVSAFGARQTPCGDPNNEMTRKYGQKAMIQRLNQELKNDTSTTNAYIKQMAAKYATSSTPGGVGQWVDHPDVGIIDCLETNSAMTQPVTSLNFQEEQCGYRCIYDNVVRLGLEGGTPAGPMGSPLPDEDILRPWWAHSAFEDFMSEKHKKVTINDQDWYNPAYHAEYKTRRQQNGLYLSYTSNTATAAATTTSTTTTTTSQRTNPFSATADKGTNTGRLPNSSPQRVTDPSPQKNPPTASPQPNAGRVIDARSAEETKKIEETKSDPNISAYRYSLGMPQEDKNDTSDVIQPTESQPTTRSLRY